MMIVLLIIETPLVSLPSSGGWSSQADVTYDKTLPGSGQWLEVINVVSKLVDSSPRQFRNFERPFSLQTWLGPSRNFSKTRFKQFLTFDFSTQQIFFSEIFGRNVSFFANLAWILTSCSEMDVKISFSVKFCSR